MRPGKLSHRVVLEEPARVSDGGGGASITWSPVASLWAAIEPLGGREQARHESLEARLSHRITLRYRAGIRPDMRLRLDARIFTIQAVMNEQEKNRWLVCLCEEVL